MAKISSIGSLLDQPVQALIHSESESAVKNVRIHSVFAVERLNNW